MASRNMPRPRKPTAYEPVLPAEAAKRSVCKEPAACKFERAVRCG